MSDVMSLLRSKLSDRPRAAADAYWAALAKLSKATPGADAERAVDDVVRAAAAAGVPATQVERNAATAMLAARPLAAPPRSYLMPSVAVCLRPLPDAAGVDDPTPCAYIRAGVTGNASPPTMTRVDGVDWQPMPGLQTAADLRDLLCVVAWYVGRRPGSHPDALAVVKREVGGLFGPSAAEVAGGRPAWRIMLASCEATVLTMAAGKSARPRGETFLLRLGRGDLVDPIRSGGGVGVN